MSQPLTLDEVGVTDLEAAQVIYDLRRENQRLRDALRRLDALAADVLGEGRKT